MQQHVLRRLPVQSLLCTVLASLICFSPQSTFSPISKILMRKHAWNSFTRCHHSKTWSSRSQQWLRVQLYQNLLRSNCHCCQLVLKLAGPLCLFCHPAWCLMTGNQSQRWPLSTPAKRQMSMCQHTVTHLRLECHTSHYTIICRYAALEMEKERRVSTAPFTARMPSNSSDMDHTVLPANYTMPAFPS